MKRLKTAASVVIAVVLGTVPAFADIVPVRTDKALTAAVITVAVVIIAAIAVLRGVIRKRNRK